MVQATYVCTYVSDRGCNTRGSVSYSFPALLMHTGPRLHVNKQEYILFLARYVLSSSPSISAAGKVVKEDSRTSTSLSAIKDDNDPRNMQLTPEK